MRRVTIECKKSRVIFEAEHFFAPGTIGEANERKACMQRSIVADANTGFLYHNRLGLPRESRALVISRALLASMESSPMVPAEVRVKETKWRIGLPGLGVALGSQEAKEFLGDRIQKQTRNV